ncbi:MAG TPA: hypothetical protein VGL23_23195 [Chloroflexota bacterium]
MFGRAGAPGLEQAVGAAPERSDWIGITHVAYMAGNGPIEPPRYARAAEAGARWNRWAMYWDQIERSSGAYDWSAVDQAAGADQEHGFATNAILLGTPGFYSTSLTAQASGPTPRVEDKSAALAVMRGQPIRRAAGAPIAPPRGLYAPAFADGTDDPAPGKAINGANVWAGFVAAAVSRYRGRVAAWEVWNEPDFSQFWSGSVADYARLLKVAWLAARSIDPSARILVGGMMYWEWTNRAGVEHAWLRAFLDEQDRDPAAAGHGRYFDAIPWHFYSRSSDSYDRIRSAASLLTSRGAAGKALWINESNAPACGEPPLNVSCSDRNYRGSASIDEQADYVVQSAAYGLAAGLERYMIFQYADDGQGESFGLFRNDGTARPAYRALQTIVEQTAGATSASRQTAGAVERIVVQTPRARVTVLWARSAATEVGSVDAIGGSATLVEVDGSARAVAPIEGRYQVVLRGATDNKGFSNDPSDYIIGGRPRILVEPTSFGPVPTPRPGFGRSILPVAPLRAPAP